VLKKHNISMLRHWVSVAASRCSIDDPRLPPTAYVANSLCRQQLMSPTAYVANSLCRQLGDDSRFFALLGSAPQELNTVRLQLEAMTRHEKSFSACGA
jgi:hypothetical protein